MRRNDEARMAKPDGMTKSENPRNYLEEAFGDDGATSVIREEPGEKRVYDLEERTARFGEAIIDFAKTIPQSAVTRRIISQLVGAGTQSRSSKALDGSEGANLIFSEIWRTSQK
jgi:hypothetical protein